MITITNFEEEIISSLQSKVHDLSIELQSHTKTCQNAMETINCELCNFVFTSKYDLNTHILLHHTKLTCFPCTSCGNVYHSELNFRNHLLKCTTTFNQAMQPNYQEPLPYASQMFEPSQQSQTRYFCEKPFLDHSNLTNHAVTTHYSTVSSLVSDYGPHRYNLSCQKCNQMFYNESDLNLHNQNYHWTNDAFVCDTCGYSCTTENILNLHKAYSHKHSQTEIHCNHCDETFTSMYKLNLHVRNDHVVNYEPASTSVDCCECGKQFQCKSELEQHRNSTHPVTIVSNCTHLS